MNQEEMLRRLSAVVSDLEELQVHVRQLEPVIAMYLAQASTIASGARDELSALGPPDDVQVLVDLTAGQQAAR